MCIRDRPECAPGPVLAHNGGIKRDPLTGEDLLEAPCGRLKVAQAGSMTVEEFDTAMADLASFLAYVAEPMALERAVAAGGDQYRERVEAAWTALTADRLASPSDHAAFHRALLSACDSGWLLRLATMLADRAGLMITVGLPKRPGSYDTAEVHRRLKELAVAGEAKAAGKELTRHLSTTLAALHAVVAAARG